MSHSKAKEQPKAKKPAVVKKYKYTGKKTQRFTAAGKIDVCLVEGAEVTLPSTDEHVKRLVAKGKLKEVKQTKSE